MLDTSANGLRRDPSRRRPKGGEAPRLGAEMSPQRRTTAFLQLQRREFNRSALVLDLDTVFVRVYSNSVWIATSQLKYIGSGFDKRVFCVIVNSDLTQIGAQTH